MLGFKLAIRERKKVSVVKVNMLRRMCDHKRNDKIQNDCIWEDIVMTPVKERNVKI